MGKSFISVASGIQNTKALNLDALVALTGEMPTSWPVLCDSDFLAMVTRLQGTANDTWMWMIQQLGVFLSGSSCETNIRQAAKAVQVPLS